ETLPPLFLELFSVLSDSIPTRFYLLEPSRGYLADMDAGVRDLDPADSMPNDGHPLVASLGRLARDFQELLLDVSHSVRGEVDRFEEPARTNLLGAIQADILELRGAPELVERELVDPSDESISLHACTGPMREAQVLHDLICSALEDDPSLKPEDIVVMTPDLEAYAPAFRAVFGSGSQQRIPYEIHDRRTRDDASLHDDFLAVLELLGSRFSVLDFIRLMDADSLRRDFRFNPDERARLAELLEASGVRWGIDAEHRAELEFPAEPVHTWRAGFERLFLGFASPPDATEVFEGSLPLGAPSLGDAQLVARLARLGEVLFGFQRKARSILGVSSWVRELQSLSESLFDEEDESSSGVRILRAALDELGEVASAGGFRGAVSLKTLKRELEAILVQKAPAVGFLRRGVTLTELVPLRSVPFRLVCLAGMSEEAFPRTDRRPSFDIMRSKHRRGDRNRRDDDRHSFLQAVLCARDRLIITYSAKLDGGKRAANPSPVVWELREAARRYYVLPSGDEALEAWAHPLHPFDPGYFDGEELPRSTSTRYLAIARALDKPSVEPSAIELRTEVDPEDEALSVSELSAWLWNPTVAFIERVLRARFGTPSLYEPASGLTELGPLEAASLGNRALRADLSGEGLSAFLGASPEFPDGTWGALERQRIGREIQVIRERSAMLDDGTDAKTRLVRAELGGYVLEGRVDDLGANQRLVQRFTAAGKQRELTVWIEHLMMGATGICAGPTRLVLRDTETHAGLVTFAPVADAADQLKTLLDLYRRSREEPIPLLEKSSRAFVEKGGKDDAPKALNAAKGELKRLRGWNPYLGYVLGDEDPFESESWREAFMEASTAVYGPLFAHRSEE
ncbi:MAG: exodeoxyribonuclease V subunit gamma, partial [Polyangiales bacterium]